MAGYTRQSSAEIVPTAVVRSAPVNAEFNQLRDAFATVTGHKHDGTSAEGAYIPLIADTDANNKVVVNTSSNRVEFHVEVSSTAVEQLRIQDGVIVPVTDNDIDLGTSSLEFKNLYLDGTAKVDTLTVDENATIAGTLGVTGLSTLPTVNVDGGTIDGAVIGGASAQAITGTLVTATTGFSGTLTGNVTGNLTGNVTANVTGNVTGNLTGNVTAASGTSTFNDVTINGGLNMNAATAATITNLTTPVNAGDAATKGYVDTNDALKLNLTGGTMSGNIAMGGNTVTGLATPSGSTDATTKTYVDTADALKLNLAGGTMSGNIAMGSNSITGLAAPVGSADAATKGYVDTAVANVIDSAPAALDTLNELAAALGDDANFSTTVTNSIATKLPLAGGTMTGDIVMGANKVTSTATPTTNDDLTRKGYVDTQDALKLNLTGGTMSGAIAMGTNQITGLGDPTLAQDAATKTYVDTADALKLNLTGGTMSGAIAMGTSKITGLGDPTANQDAATKVYVDNADALKLSLTGGTMTGNIVMGANKVTSTATPTTDDDLTRKAYVDSILGSATAAAISAANALTSETNAATSAGNALTSENNAAASFDSFDDRYLGAKASAPSVDNDGDALLTGAIYWNTSSNSLFIWTGSAWSAAAFDTSGALIAVNNLSELTNFATARDNLGLGTGTPTNGQLLIGNGTDFTTAALAAGTGISVTNGAGSVTITNTAPDQTVSLSASTGISVSGSYPSFTVTNTAPDQTVVLTQGANITITGTYPNFTIASADQFTGTVTSVGGTGTVNGLSLSGTVTTSGNLTLGGTLAISNADWSGTDLAVTNGGTGASSFTANTVLLGNGTSSFQTVAPGTSGNVLTSNGTTWVSQALDALDTQTATTSSTAQTAIATYATASFDAAKVVVVADNGTDRSVSELLITWKSTTAYATEYAIINTGAAALATYAVDVSGGNFRILATAASATSTSYTVKAITL